MDQISTRKRDGARNRIVEIPRNWEEDLSPPEEPRPVELPKPVPSMPGSDEAGGLRHQLKPVKKREPVMIELPCEAKKESVPLEAHPINLAKATDQDKKEELAKKYPEPPKGHIVKEVQSKDKNLPIDDKARLIKIEKAKREIQKEDMKMFRKEAAALAEEEKHMFRDGNARDRMTYSLLVQAVKLVDLWEQANHYMDVIDIKSEDLGKVQVRLSNKIEEREGLETDNENLRNEIASLETKLAAQTKKNEEKDKLCSTIYQNIALKKMKAKSMVDRIKKVKANQEMLTGTMANANSALSKAFENLEAQFC